MLKNIDNENLKFEIIIGIIIAFAIILFVIATIFIFKYVIKKYKNEEKRLMSSMPNARFEVIIDIKNKVVIKRKINTFGEDKTIKIKLNDFIYSLSINPESKAFRELLKLIDNDATLNQINRKYSSMSKKTLLVTFNNPEDVNIEEKASVAILDFDLDQTKVDKHIKFWTSESYFQFKKKEEFKPLLTQGSEFLDENKLYQALSKEIKAVKTKGWTIIRVENRFGMLSSWKDFGANTLQLSKLRMKLAEEEINTYFSENGALYFVQTSGRNSNNVSISRYWNNRIESLLSQNKKYYFDITSNEIRVLTANDIVKDNKSIDSALIRLELLSESTPEEREGKKYYEKLIEKSFEIHKNASKIYKDLKEGSIKILSTERKLKEKKPKNIIEFYIDTDVKRLDEAIKYSIFSKKDIIKFAVNAAIKKASKNSETICHFVVNIREASIIASILDNMKAVPNFYISLSENQNHTTKATLRNDIKQIKENNFKIIHLIRDINDGSPVLGRILEPSYILIARNFKKTEDKDERIEIALSKLQRINSKNTKTINIDV